LGSHSASILVSLKIDDKDLPNVVQSQDCKRQSSVRTQRAYIIGSAVGQTNVVFFDTAGQQIASYDIAVKRDLKRRTRSTEADAAERGIQIEGVGEGVMLTGSVSSPIEAQQAGDLAARLVGGADKVVNSIAVRGPRSGDVEGSRSRKCGGTSSNRWASISPPA